MLWNYFGITTQSGYTDDDETGYTLDDDAYHYYGSQHSPMVDSSPSIPSSPTARSIAIKITSTITRPFVQALQNNMPGISPLGSPRQDSASSLLNDYMSFSPETQITFSTSSSPTLAGDIFVNKPTTTSSTTEDEEKKKEDSYWAMYSSVQGTADSTVPSPPSERRELKLFQPHFHHSSDIKEDYDAFGKAIPVSTFDKVALDPEADDPAEDFIRRVEEERSERWSSSSGSSLSSSSSSSRKASRSRSVGGKFNPSSTAPCLDRVPDADSEFESDPFGRGFEDAFTGSGAPTNGDAVNPLPPCEGSLGLSLGPAVLNPTTTTTSREDQEKEDTMARQIRGIYDEWLKTSHRSSSQESFISFVRESLASHHL